MKKVIIFLILAAISSNSYAQMVVNDPINGAMGKVLDMLNPKLTQQLQQVKRAKEQLREQVAITTASETNANASMAEIDYQSNVSKFSSNFALQGLKMKAKEDDNATLYNTGVNLINQLPPTQTNYIKYYSKLYTKLKDAMGAYGSQANLLGYKSGGSTTNISDTFSGSSGALTNTNNSADEQAFIDAKNKADKLAQDYKDQVSITNKQYNVLIETVSNPPSGGWLGSVFKGLANIVTLGISNDVLDKIAEKGKAGVESWYSGQTKNLDESFNSGMSALGFGDLLSASSGALGMQMGSGKAIKIDPKNGLMDDAGKIALGYNITDKLDQIHDVLEVNNANMQNIIYSYKVSDKSIKGLIDGSSIYNNMKDNEGKLISPKTSNGY